MHPVLSTVLEFPSDSTVENFPLRLFSYSDDDLIFSRLGTDSLLCARYPEHLRNESKPECTSSMRYLRGQLVCMAADYKSTRRSGCGGDCRCAVNKET
jgi:hypothetical protein